jgi:hypothetical protein
MSLRKITILLLSAISILSCKRKAEEVSDNTNEGDTKVFVEGTVYVESGSRKDEIQFDWIKK